MVGVMRGQVNESRGVGGVLNSVLPPYLIFWLEVDKSICFAHTLIEGSPELFRRAVHSSRVIVSTLLKRAESSFWPATSRWLRIQR